MNQIISWDEYFMGIAKLSAKRSKDPNTQVGCCIVNQDKRIVAVGYNGLPKNCIDEEYPWANRVGELQDTKYAYVVHAELNAILNATTPLKGCSLYVTLYPCNECVKSIIQSGIAEIIFEDNGNSNAAMDKTVYFDLVVNAVQIPSSTDSNSD